MSVAEPRADKHDVGLVNSGDLLAAVGNGVLECKLNNTCRRRAGNQLDALDYTLDNLMYK